MKNKKVLIIVFLIIVTIIIVTMKHDAIKNYITGRQIENIKYDIKITSQERQPTKGGAVFFSHYWLINLKDRKLYNISERYAVGDGNYDNIMERDLSQEQIDEIMQLADMESEEIVRTGGFEDYKRGYYRIDFQGKEIILNELPFEDEEWWKSS